MHHDMTPREAVRQAKDALGDAPAQELAAFIRERYGLAIKPPIVTVILGTFQERDALTRSAQAAEERIQQWRADNPQEAKKLAAAARRREAARKTSTATAAPQSAAAPSTRGEIPALGEPAGADDGVRIDGEPAP
jgi:hypothetical protein